MAFAAGFSGKDKTPRRGSDILLFPKMPENQRGTPTTEVHWNGPKATKAPAVFPRIVLREGVHWLS